MADGFNGGAESAGREWQAAGGNLATALQEIATALGGEDLAEQVAQAAASGEVLPGVAAFQMLENLHPGSTARVIERSNELQAAAAASRLAAIRRLS